MVFSNSSHKCFTVVSSAEDEYSGGKTRKEYCKKGEILFVTANKGNVLIVFGQNGYFPIETSNVTETMIDTAEKLINAIKTVDLRMAYGFPHDFVIGITENKPWEAEFIEKLRESDVRQSLKKEILERYESNSVIKSPV